MICTVLFKIFPLEVFGEETKNFQDLLNETNTYECVPNYFTQISKNENDNYNKIQRSATPTSALGFDLTKPRPQQGVYSGQAQITVFNHGMAGSADDWSNNGSSFAYDKESLVFKLAKKYKTKVIWAKMLGGIDTTYTGNMHNFNLYNINYENMTDEAKINVSDSDKITEFQNNYPIILIYDADEIQDNQDGDYLYKAFTYLMSRVVKMYKVKNGNLLPKINLIGYSYGGILNLKYAMSHPDMISSIYSINTPYFGSNTTTVLQGWKKAVNSSKTTYSLLRNDIIDPDTFTDYSIIWNTYYETYYNHINYHALGGYSSISFIASALINRYINFDDLSSEAIITVLAVAASSIALVGGIGLATKLVNKLIGNQNNEYSSEFWNAIENLLLSFDVKTRLNFSKIILYDDTCVHLPSQLGLNYAYYTPGLENIREQNKYYKGFTRYIKEYDSYSDDEIYNKSANLIDPPVTHNIAPHFSDNINYIYSNISMVGDVDATVNFEYELNTNNTVTITKYIGSETNVTIPLTIDGKNVSEIGEYAFADLPVTTINVETTVNQGEEISYLNSIDNFAFKNCTSLTSINIPSSVTLIQNGAFHNCSALSNITLPYNLYYLNTTAFVGCDSLNFTNSTGTYYSVSQNCIIKNNELIFASNATSIPSGITSIVDSAFVNNTTITNLNIPNTVTNIGDNAFYGSAISSLTLPSSLTTIGNNAFGDCSNLTSLTIPSGVTQIGNYAFGGCFNVSTINYNATNCNDVSKNSFVFLNTGIGEDVSSLTVNIGNNVTRIPAHLFENTTAMTTLNIGTGVTSIGNSAFAYCDNLSTINFNATNCGDLSAGNKIFYDSGLDADSLTLNVGNGVTRIPAFLMQSNEYLTNVSISASVSEIKASAFFQCPILNTITVATANTTFTSSNNVVVKNSNNQLVVGGLNFVIPSTVTSIGEYAFAGRDIVNVVIPASVTSLGDRVFCACTKLKSVTFANGNNLTYVGSYAFAYCRALRSITIPPAIASTMSLNVFFDCLFTSVRLTSSVATVREYVFSGCRIDGYVYIDNPTPITVSDGVEYRFGSTFESIMFFVPDYTAQHDYHLDDDWGLYSERIMVKGNYTDYLNVVLISPTIICNDEIFSEGSYCDINPACVLANMYNLAGKHTVTTSAEMIEVIEDYTDVIFVFYDNGSLPEIPTAYLDSNGIEYHIMGNMWVDDDVEEELSYSDLLLDAGLKIGYKYYENLNIANTNNYTIPSEMVISVSSDLMDTSLSGALSDSFMNATFTDYGYGSINISSITEGTEIIGLYISFEYGTEFDCVIYFGSTIAETMGHIITNSSPNTFVSFGNGYENILIQVEKEAYLSTLY